MVTFKQKMDSCGKIYIVKPLRQMGLVNTIEIVPNAKAAVIYRAGTEPSEIIASLQVIIADFKHREKMQKKKGAEINSREAFPEPR
jgi:hypothetical protein